MVVIKPLHAHDLIRPLHSRAFSFSSKRWGSRGSERARAIPRVHRKWQARHLHWGLASSLGSFLPLSERSWGPGSNHQTLCPAALTISLTLGFLSDPLSPKGAWQQVKAGEGVKVFGLEADRCLIPACLQNTVGKSTYCPAIWNFNEHSRKSGAG